MALKLFGRRRGEDTRVLRPEEDVFDESFMRQLELLQVVARRLLRGRQRAERKTKKVGSGLEFADHREYSPGDDIRNVDWGVLARLDQTLVRLYEEDEDEKKDSAAVQPSVALPANDVAKEGRARDERTPEPLCFYRELYRIL